MPDYSKGKIYKIVCNETGFIYIGSTVQKLNIRISDHKKDYKAWLDGKIHYITSFDIIKNNNYYIELIEDYPCESKLELEMREGYWQKQMDCVNKCIAGAACGDIKAYMKNYQKKYEQTDKRKAYNKARKSTLEHKAHHAEYMRQRRAKKKLQLQENQNNNLDV
jgi:hypothetical protein